MLGRYFTFIKFKDNRSALNIAFIFDSEIFYSWNKLKPKKPPRSDVEHLECECLTLTDSLQFSPYFYWIFFYWKIHVVEQLNAGATTFISISISWYLNCFHYWREKERGGSGWKRRRERGSERRRGDKEREREKEMLENSLISCFNTQHIQLHIYTYVHATFLKPSPFS